MPGHGTCAMGEPSPCLLPQVLFSSHRWQRQVEFCSSLVSRGMRGQSRFCLAHKPNLTAIKPGLVCIPSHVQLCWVQRVHSLFWALLIGEFSKKHEHPPLAFCRAAERAGRAGHIAEGCSAFPPWPSQRQLSARLAPTIFSSKTNPGPHPQCCGLGLFFPCITIFL